VTHLPSDHTMKWYIQIVALNDIQARITFQHLQTNLLSAKYFTLQLIPESVRGNSGGASVGLLPNSAAVAKYSFGAHAA
jgi:hypothetical protein